VKDSGDEFSLIFGGVVMNGGFGVVVLPSASYCLRVASSSGVRVW
jgi:hypothetical protein